MLGGQGGNANDESPGEAPPDGIDEPNPLFLYDLLSSFAGDAEVPADGDEDEGAALLGDCDGDGLADWEELLLGGEICNPFDGPDIDGDGIENGEDDDVDGDGIENGDDPDVDGDGLLNGEDDDVDGDGIANGDDSDVDGDFIRNRFDLDIDGDGSFNPFDNDIDGDGKEDEWFDYGDEDDEDEGGGTDEDEFKAFQKQFEKLLEDVDDELEELQRKLEEADPIATDDELLEAAANVIEHALADNPPKKKNGKLDTEAIRQAVKERTEVIEKLDGVELFARLSKITEVVDRLHDASKEHDTPLKDIVDATVALGEIEIAPDLSEVADTAEKLIAEAVAKDIPTNTVAESVGSVDKIADEVRDEESLTEVWSKVAGLIAGTRDEDGEGGLEPSSVIEAVERIASLIEDPTIDQLVDSSRNILKASQEKGLDDPGAVVDELEASDADLSDGVSEEEADAAAESVADQQGSD